MSVGTLWMRMAPSLQAGVLTEQNGDVLSIVLLSLLPDRRYTASSYLATAAASSTMVDYTPTVWGK